MRIPQTPPNGQSMPAPTTDADVVWVELSCRFASWQSRDLRGRLRREELERLISGQATGFVRLLDCYWFTEPVCEEEWETTGDYTRLGAGLYANFTGEVIVRCDTVVGISVLKSGFDGEPAGL